MVKKNKNSKSTANRVWNAICWPFKKVAEYLRRLWNWIANINLVALLNLALLVSIIILFSLLIIDLRKGANASDGDTVMPRVVAETPFIAEEPKAEEKPTPVVKPRPRKITTLPIKHDNFTRKQVAMPIQVAKVKENPVAVRQVAIQDKTAYGDIVVDHYDMRNVLPNGAHVTGNLYIQDLRKYTLPCNIVIDGNLILRDVNILNFCGDFTVRGNIYVSPRSSFGPVPSTARIGGQVLL